MSLWLNRVKDSTNPLLPPYIHPSVKSMGQDLSKKFHYNTKEVVTTKPTQVNLLNVRMYYTVRLNILPMGNIVVLDIKASENIL